MVPISLLKALLVRSVLITVKGPPLTVCVTTGGLAGVGAKITGVFGDAVAKLTFDQEFQEQRRQGDASIGKGIEGLGKV